MIGRGFYRYGFGVAGLLALSLAHRSYGLTTSGFDERGLFVGSLEEPKPSNLPYGPIRKGRRGKVKRW